jgi:cytochrome c oxidase assembly factor CtaG
VSWWCSASKDPWTWTPQAYPGIWLFMGFLLVAYLWATRNPPRPANPGKLVEGSSDPAPPSVSPRLWRNRWAFLGGWIVLWLATDWPLGTLGAGYLATAHMAQYVLYTMAAAPLLVLGIPEWTLRRLLSRLRAYRAVRMLAQPIIAGLVFNAVLVATHAPITVDTFRTNQLGSFLLDLAWLASALLLWLPVCGPLEELKPSLPARGVYLFLAAGLVPMVPGGFLTFAGTPLYAVYELAPRVGVLNDALDDQQAAGAIMKVGNLPLLWPVLAGIFIRWANQERAPSPTETQPTPKKIG